MATLSTTSTTLTTSTRTLQEFENTLEKLTHLDQIDVQSRENVETAFALISQFFFLYRYFLSNLVSQEQINQLDSILKQIQPIYSIYFDALSKFPNTQNYYHYNELLGSQNSESYLSYLLWSILSIGNDNDKLFETKSSIVKRMIPQQENFSNLFEFYCACQFVPKWQKESNDNKLIIDSHDERLRKQLMTMMILWSETPNDIQPFKIVSLFSHFQKFYSNNENFAPLIHFMAKCLWYVNYWSSVDQTIESFSSWSQMSNIDNDVIKKLTQNIKVSDQLIHFLSNIANTNNANNEKLVKLLIELAKYDPEIIKSVQKDINLIKLPQTEREYFVTFEKTNHLMKNHLFSQIQTNSLSTLVNDLSFSSIKVLDVSKSRCNILIRSALNLDKIIEKVRHTICFIIDLMPENKKVANFDITKVIIDLIPARVLTPNQPTHQMELRVSGVAYSDRKLREFLSFWAKNHKKYEFESFPHIKIHSIDEKNNKMMVSLKHPSNELFADYEILYALIQKMESGYQSYPPDCFQTKEIMVYSTNELNIRYKNDPVESIEIMEIY